MMMIQPTRLLIQQNVEHGFCVRCCYKRNEEESDATDLMSCSSSVEQHLYDVQYTISQGLSASEPTITLYERKAHTHSRAIAHYSLFRSFAHTFFFSFVGCILRNSRCHNYLCERQAIIIVLNRCSFLALSFMANKLLCILFCERSWNCIKNSHFIVRSPLNVRAKCDF